MTTKDQSMLPTPQPITFGSLFSSIKAPRWIAALVSLAITMPALAQCPLSFAAAANYAAGSSPYSVAVGDFNADGFVNADDFDSFVAAFETGC